jgi:hypothetical protein
VLSVTSLRLFRSALANAGMTEKLFSQSSIILQHKDTLPEAVR